MTLNHTMTDVPAPSSASAGAAPGRDDAAIMVESAHVSYGSVQALQGVSLHVGHGETVAVIGANGAGKTTLLKAICGLVPLNDGRITVLGEPVADRAPFAIARQGVALVPEGRRVFPSLSVEDNLRVAAEGTRRQDAGDWSLARVYDLFPALKAHAGAPSPTLSGGQQQMLAVGRGLMANPEVLLLDELSLGLAPVAVQSVYDKLEEIRAAGITIVLVEQNVQQSLGFADRVYCLLTGRLSLEGCPEELSMDAVRNAYFGV